MPTLILSTCGTSLLTNSVSSELRGLLTRYANESDWDSISEGDKAQLEQHLNEREQSFLAQTDIGKIKKQSAELNGLITWQEKNPTIDLKDSQTMLYLLKTDTILGDKTAQIIRQWLEINGYQVQIISAEGLKTSSLGEFRESLKELTKELTDLFQGYKDSGYQIYVNLTGGFKSLNGFLQALSGLYADEVFYLFEGSSDLLTIPKLPIAINDNAIINNLTAFRRLEKCLSVNEEALKSVPDILLFNIDDSYTLSEWGEVLWANYKNKHYKTRILPSISEQIIFDSEFEKSCKDFPEQIIEKINETIAQLAVFAESDGTTNLRSLDAKPLQEKQYRDNNFWECDIDGKRYRIFMQKQGKNYVLKKTGDALHKANSTI